MFIRHLIQKKLKCIGTRTNGLLPDLYFDPKFNLVLDEIEKFNCVKIQFDKGKITKAIDDSFELPIDKKVLDKMTWYTDLEKNMRIWDTIEKEAEFSPITFNTINVH